MRQRLRDSPGPEELAQLYAEPHDARRFGAGHGLRVETTIALAASHCGWSGRPEQRSIADLSCGNAEIPTEVARRRKVPAGEVWLGDFAPSDSYQFEGPLELTAVELYEARESQPVDVFICSETIEHLDDPDAALLQLRGVARELILSTPIGELKPPPGAGNPEHCWSWLVEDMMEMLREAGWRPKEHLELWLTEGGLPTYDYMIIRAT